ncbi:DNA polymerase I [Tenuibacillus multivorans]|uniref:DNA polymerase I n=1 Tax=Tenuibacillus multivorans TaxID=237069 RepID=A0A1G9ZT38_9BACI|nr:DNA polymerase I [Tenuibacillus multivorans]GEL76837.1 DNA polymerase I [Tenuibacillus multivorans]SDN24344.1 DNA polymerase I [Tenuibacillus multivorans]
MSDEIILIDGNSVLYRAFFALPLLSNDSGVHTNAVFGFTNMLLKILEEKDPSHILVAFDAGKTTFRHETYKEYKGGRQKTPPELSEQFPIMREMLDALGIKHYELPQYEADDIIGTISKQADQDHKRTFIYSGDKDLLQLASDYVTVGLTRKGITEIDEYVPDQIKEKMGITTDQVIDLKALMGDKSDNIPGVPGVGEKTAVKLLNQFGTLENVYENVDEVSGKKLKEKLINHKEEAFMSQQLATINRKSPIDIKVNDLSYEGYQSRDVIELFKTYGFKSLMGRIEGSDEAVEREEITFEKVETFTKDIVSPEGNYLIMEMLEDNYHIGGLLGFALVNNQGHYYIPTDVALNSNDFISWIEDENSHKVVADVKRLKVALKWKGINLQGVDFDLVLASYIANPSISYHDLPSIGQGYGFNVASYDEEVYGKGAKQSIPEEEVFSEHIVRKGIVAQKLHHSLSDELKSNEQEDLFYQLEMPLSHILADMEYKGVQVDVDRLEDMQQDLSERLDKIEEEIYELADQSFNINSPKQLGKVLFEDLGLPVIKKTKTGYSTSADVLEKLQHEHEIIEKILLYRQLGKLQSTYIEGLLKVVHDDNHKIHTRFNQVLTQTGRLSSIDPNLQNIPIRLEEGRKIRQAFIPSKEDSVIFAADYSQIELRVLAHIANDEKLIAAFKEGKDIHTQTAMDVFNVNEDEVESLMRRHAKAVNFGIVYGISDYGLSQSLGITRKEAGKFIEKYFESYPGVKAYMDDIVQQAKRDGFVETIMNRRRYLPDITSRNFNKRSFAERTAMNTPIQGSAADIIKKAMIDVMEQLNQTDIRANLLLQVHDELIFEVNKEDIEQLEALVKDAMENTVDLDVPLLVEADYGTTWYDAK